MADEDAGGEIGSFVPANKKLTCFVIDGSESMFAGGNDACAFRKAVKVIYSQMVNVCCSGSLNHMLGVVVTNTKETQNRANHKNSFEWIKMAVPSSEDAIELKKFLDSDDIHATFNEKFGGHSSCNLGHVIWGCRKVMQLSATSARHHMLMFFTNQASPFADEKDYLKLQKLIQDFTCTNYRDRNGLTKIIKTPGAFHVALMCDSLEPSQRKKWEAITPMVFHGNAEQMETQTYKKTFSQRAFSSLDVELAPGIKFGVGVYLLAKETTVPTRQLLDAETEAKVERKSTYVARINDETKEESREEDEAEKGGADASQVKKSVQIGGMTIVTEKKEVQKLSYFDAKGIVLLGFKPIADIDLTTHLQSAQLLYPDETNIHGSSIIYASLLQRCYARKMAMICRFCSRSNQKVRLVALVPQKKLTEDEMVFEVSSLQGSQREKKLEALRLANEYQHNGFLVIFLPFAEDLRDLSEQMKGSVTGGWPRTSEAAVVSAAKFVEQLTQPYTPENYYNPRLRSFNAMLVEAAIGDQIPHGDSLLPYFKTASSSVIDDLSEPLRQAFDLDGLDDDAPGTSKRAAGFGFADTPSKKAKFELPAMATKEIAEKGMLDKLTVAQLRDAARDVGLKPDTSAKKADLVTMLQTHFNV